MDRSLSNSRRTLPGMTLAVLLGLILILSACAPKNDGGAATGQPLVSASAEPLAEETPPPGEPDAAVLPTAAPSGSVYGRWVPDLATVTILINNPSGNQMCQPDANYWMPELVIREGSNADSVVIEGLVEDEVRYVPLNLATMTMTDFITYPGSTETSINTLRLEADGRLYHEEQDSLDGLVYCAASIYYIRADE